MKSRKYSKDYILIEKVLPSGRIKTTAQYIGDDYFFKAEAGVLKEKRLFCAAVLPVCWILYLAALIPSSYASHLMYVILPFVASAFPLLFLSESLWCFLRSDEPLTREKADKISHGLPIGSLLTFLFCGVSCLGLVITAIFTPEAMALPGDMIFGLSSLILAALSGTIFRFRAAVGAFRVEKPGRGSLRSLKAEDQK